MSIFIAAAKNPSELGDHHRGNKCRVGRRSLSEKCNGNIVIEDFAYIGSGAVIRQGKPGAPLVIGRGATVGMGAVVTRNVPAGAIVVGNPARLLKKES